MRKGGGSRFRYPALISIDFDGFTSPITPQFLFRWRRYIKHSRQCFIGYPNTSNFVKNTPLLVVFSTLSSVLRYPRETLSLLNIFLHIVITVLLSRTTLHFTSTAKQNFVANWSVSHQLGFCKTCLFNLPIKA